MKQSSNFSWKNVTFGVIIGLFSIGIFNQASTSLFAQPAVLGENSSNKPKPTKSSTRPQPSKIIPTRRPTAMPKSNCPSSDLFNVCQDLFNSYLTCYSPSQLDDQNMTNFSYQGTEVCPTTLPSLPTASTNPDPLVNKVCQQINITYRHFCQIRFNGGKPTSSITKTPSARPTK